VIGVQCLGRRVVLRTIPYYRDAVAVMRTHTASIALGQALIRTGKAAEGWGSAGACSAGKDPTLACDALVDALEPRDSAWFVTFADQIALKIGQTRNKFAIRRAFSTLGKSGGASMWDKARRRARPRGILLARQVAAHRLGPVVFS
jgi:hypothetical protein